MDMFVAGTVVIDGKLLARMDTLLCVISLLPSLGDTVSSSRDQFPASVRTDAVSLAKRRFSVNDP